LVAVVLVVDVGALLAVVEAGVILVVVPGRGWGRLGGVGDREVAERADGAASDGTPGAVVIVGRPVLSVLGAVLVFLGGAVGRVVVFRGEDVGVAAGATTLGGYPRVAAAVLSWLLKNKLFKIASSALWPVTVGWGGTGRGGCGGQVGRGARSTKARLF
jgi:hypothetical protein